MNSLDTDQLRDELQVQLHAEQTGLDDSLTKLPEDHSIRLWIGDILNIRAATVFEANHTEGPMPSHVLKMQLALTKKAREEAEHYVA